MYKIAGELTPTVFHVTARSLSAQALSIFGDHSDVMAVRQTGFAMLCSNNVQEVMDFALISQKATLESGIPIVHFFDGFRTSHEVMKIEQLNVEDIREMIDDKFVKLHRSKALNPNNPFIRGTAQNPDVYFQGRETVNKYYNEFPAVMKNAMNKFFEITGRQYDLFEYYGSPEADRIIIMMGSGCGTVEETIDELSKNHDEKIGLLKVRLYRPFDLNDFVKNIPHTVKNISVLDRTKEPGSIGEPLYLDVVTALNESMNSKNKPFEKMPYVTGGRYGLSSKEFTPAMVKAVFDEMKKDEPKNHFTVGINDDVTFTSLDYNKNFKTAGDKQFGAMFFGLGSDGTVGANKNSIKIIGEETDNFAQGYFVYDSKKSGSTTVSHLRFGKEQIKSSYLIESPDFIGCHLFSLLEKFDMLKDIKPGGTFLLNTIYNKDEIFDKLPAKVGQQIIDKKLNFYIIDAFKVAGDTGMGLRINTIMQTCFFAISGVLPKDEAIQHIKNSIKKTYLSKGDEIINKNFEAVDKTLENLFKVDITDKKPGEILIKETVSSKAPEYVRNVLGKIIEGMGDDVKVSEMPADGTFPTGTAQWEKRNIAHQIPVWDESICIQCGKCAMICPHACIRIKSYDEEYLNDAPPTFKHMPAKGKEFGVDKVYTIQVAPEDCTGCTLCFEICPVKNKTQVRLKALNMEPQLPLKEQESKNWDHFLSIPEFDRREVNTGLVKSSQLFQPLFEFSGACTGCGETPYVKLVSQLYGDRAVIANATGCSSIYGGNLPTTPWTKNSEGRGPAWSNSLFEDNAEFGLGMRISVDKHNEYAKELLLKLRENIGDNLVDEILNADQSDEPGIYEQRKRIEELNNKLKVMNTPDAEELLSISDYLVKRSVWIIGGDGWAYDIGFGGLDHVIATGKNVNILVLDTEVYSNTGGQMSKATGLAAVAKFATSGKPTPKKDLAMMAINYGSVYVAKVAMGANDTHTLKSFLEAESFDGPSLIIAYSHCIAHGINMEKALDHQKNAVKSGYWPLFRYDPRLIEENKNPFRLDSGEPAIKLEEYAYSQARYKMLTKSDPEHAKKLMKLAQEDVKKRFDIYKKLAEVKTNSIPETETVTENKSENISENISEKISDSK
ncbi:MAG: pyruvate:ferredoxin (flavodoxin) oxidoreductase, partial [Ignavibacteria bacterium]